MSWPAPTRHTARGALTVRDFARRGLAAGFLDGLVGVVPRAVRVAAGAAVETVEGEAVAVIIEGVGTSRIRTGCRSGRSSMTAHDAQPTQPPMPSRSTSRQPESTHGRARLLRLRGRGGVGRLRRVAVRGLGCHRRRTAVGRKVAAGLGLRTAAARAGHTEDGACRRRAVEVAAAEERTHSPAAEGARERRPSGQRAGSAGRRGRRARSGRRVRRRVARVRSCDAPCLEG